MPAGNGTGPMGRGPMTGRAAGYCAGYSVPGFINPGPGRGAAFGCGRGRGGWGLGAGRGFRGGWNPGYYAGPAWTGTEPGREQQLTALKAQADYFEGALNDLRQRMKDIGTPNTEA